MSDVKPVPENSGLRVTQWARDADAGQINAFDDQGRLLMAIPAGPLFGPRLAAAFGSPVSHARPTDAAPAVGPPPRLPR